MIIIAAVALATIATALLVYHRTRTRCPKCGSARIEQYCDGEFVCKECHAYWAITDDE